MSEMYEGIKVTTKTWSQAVCKGSAIPHMLRDIYMIVKVQLQLDDIPERAEILNKLANVLTTKYNFELGMYRHPWGLQRSTDTSPSVWGISMMICFEENDTEQQKEGQAPPTNDNVSQTQPVETSGK